MVSISKQIIYKTQNLRRIVDHWGTVRGPRAVEAVTNDDTAAQRWPPLYNYHRLSSGVRWPLPLLYFRAFEYN